MWSTIGASARCHPRAHKGSGAVAVTRERARQKRLVVQAEAREVAAALREKEANDPEMIKATVPKGTTVVPCAYCVPFGLFEGEPFQT